MVGCAYCKKVSVKWKHLSFHKFPTEEKLKQRWIENMGWPNWEPKSSSTLCSEHFAENCIDFRDVRARLRKGHCPTIFKNNEDSPLRHQAYPYANNTDPVTKRIKIEPEDFDSDPSGEGPISDIPNHSIIGQNLYGIVSKVILEQQPHGGPLPVAGRTPIEAFNHDHTYSKSIATIERQLEVALTKNSKLMRENDLLNSKQKRLVKRLKKVQNVMTDLRKSSKLQSSGKCHFNK